MEKDVVNKSNKSLSIVLLLIIGLSFTYCKNEIIRYYYESGELETEQLIINDSMSYVKDYYKNGKLLTSAQ
jgi:antitoxin component YwqK of YwqJK toxin-antitoxin module